MDMQELESVLGESAPRDVASLPGVSEAVVAAANAAHRAVRRRRAAVRWIWIPAVVVATPVLAGAAAGGLDSVIPAYSVPIVYTTDTGRSVACSYEVFDDERSPFAPHDTVSSDWFRAQDWTGFGDRVYADAIALRDDPSSEIYDFSIGTGEPPSAAVLDQTAFSVAVVSSIGAMPGHAELGAASPAWGRLDCTGELH